MSYYRISENDTRLSRLGCSPSCSCAACQQTVGPVPRLGERYLTEDEEEESPNGASAPARRAPPPVPRLSGPGWLGQLPARRPRTWLTGDLQLRMPPFETITGFAPGSASLGGPQVERVNRVADFIARSWSGTAAITSVRVTGYIDRDEWQPNLGQQRAVAVRDALVVALNRSRPGLATRLSWLLEDRGLGNTAKVEIYLWAGPTPPPVPPLVRIPSPAEAARAIVPMRPETAEERIQRILRTPVPSPPPRRSFSQMFWQRVDETVNSTMSRLRVPQSLRGHIRDGIHAAITRGSEALLNQILEATGLPGNVQEAIRGTVRGLLQVPLR